jgi:YVTN family beta-propeller protein
MRNRTQWTKVFARVLIAFATLAAPVAARPAQAQTFAYVADLHTSTISAIDTASNTVVATVTLAPLRSEPYGVAITPDGTRVYVTNWNVDTGDQHG